MAVVNKAWKKECAFTRKRNENSLYCLFYHKILIQNNRNFDEKFVYVFVSYKKQKYTYKVS